MGVEKERRPLLLMEGRNYTAEQLEALREALGLSGLREDITRANIALRQEILEVATRVTALEALGSVSLLGSAPALNLEAVQAYDTGIDWPDPIADLDQYIVAAEVNGRIGQIVQGDRISGIDAGAAGAALAAGAAIPLYPVDVTGAAALASLGKSADGDVLLQPAAADADARIAIFRIVADG